MHPMYPDPFYIIFPSSRGFPSAFLSLGFSTKILEIFFSLSHTCYMIHPPHFPWLNNPNNSLWTLQIIKLLIMLFSSAFHYLLQFQTKYSPQHPVLKHTINLCSSLRVRQSLTPPENSQDYSSVFNPYTLGMRWEDKRFWTEWKQHSL
jgi:hypothetical protein